MNNRNNVNLGDEIKNKVQDALNKRDFKKLNRDIGNIAKSALDEVKTSINGKFNNQNNRKRNNNTTKDNPKKVSNYNKIKNQNNNKAELSLKASKLAVPVGQFSSTLLRVLGGIGTGAFGIALFVLILLGFTIGKLFFTVSIGISPFLIISIILLANGMSMRNRLRRFNKYNLYLKGKRYCKIEDLSLSTGLSKKFIEKDLNKMILNGMYPQGHIDDKRTWFMLNDESYSQYLELQKGIELSNLEKYKEEINRDSKSKKDSLTPEMRKSIDEGRKLVLEIKDANIVIPGEEISNKLDRLEEVTGKIFDYVEIHPEKFAEIKKFTEYFLPTTLKLLEAYRKLDYQSVQGDNISNSKAEIEKTLDTINIAFENLLDDLFHDIAMDISTDISVLETMFLQEGLTKDEMRIKNNDVEDEK